MYYTVDKIENNIAELIDEKGHITKINTNELPRDTKEGHILYKLNSMYRIDQDKTKKKQDEIRKLLDDLFQENKK